MPAQSSSPAASQRDLLLERTIEHLAAHGLGDTSLRQLADALSTSHRMLIYHFGSKEGLLVAVVQAVEDRQRAVLAEIVGHGDTDGTSGEVAQGADADILRRIWHQLADPVLWPHERLFFELYGQALQGRPHAASLLDGVVDDWVTPAVERACQHGMDERSARAEARLGLAVIRGLLLDLLATGDRQGADDAMECHIAAVAAVAARHPAVDIPATPEETDRVEHHAIVTVDTQGVITSWDKGAETLFGHSAAEAVGQSLDLIVPAELAEAHWAGFHRAMAEPKLADLAADLPVRCADGEVRHFAGRLVVLLDGLGEAVGATAIFAATGTTGVRPFG